MKEFITQFSTELNTGERETPKMKLTNAQRIQLNTIYDTLTRLKILAGDIDNNDLAVAADNLQNIIDEL